MRTELRAIQKRVGITFIYITHDQGEALTMSDRVAVMSNGVIQQTGPGPEIYNDPKTAFVASFVGENNPMFGRVTRAENGHAAVDTVFGSLLGRNSQGLKVGDKAVLFIRPEALRVASPGAVNQFESEVLTSELEGSLIHVRLKGESHKAITVSLTNNGIAELPAPGTRVRVGFDPDRAVVLPHGPLADE
jgi:spermidine/putrescine transport system ATP-binding protein